MQLVLFPSELRSPALLSGSTSDVIQPGLGAGLVHRLFKGPIVSSVCKQIEWKLDVSSSVFKHIEALELSSSSQRPIKVEENRAGVEELKIWQRWGGAHRLTRHWMGMSSKIGTWSEKTVSQMSKLETHRPCESTKSSVCPSSWVGPHTDCTKLKESMTFQKFLEISSSGQQVWILKSPIIRTRSYLGRISAKNSERSLIKSLLYLGGR